MHRLRARTLVELLVVIAIVGIVDRRVTTPPSAPDPAMVKVVPFDRLWSDLDRPKPVCR